MSEDVSGSSVFESTFAALRKRRTESTSYDDVGGGFGEEYFPAAGDACFGGGEMGGDLGEALAGYWGLVLHKNQLIREC